MGDVLDHYRLMEALEIIRDESPMYLRKFAFYMHWTVGHANPFLKKLISNGLVAHDNQKVRFYRLTDEGRSWINGD